MILQVLTDKVHRSVAAIRDVCKNHGGKMADSGSIMFKFKRARVLTVKASDVDKDELLIIALDAGADDVIEPSMDEDNPEEDSERCLTFLFFLTNYDLLYLGKYLHYVPLFLMLLSVSPAYVEFTRCVNQVS